MDELERIDAHADGIKECVRIIREEASKEKPKDDGDKSEKAVKAHVAFIVGHTAKSSGAYSKTLGQSEYWYYKEMFADSLVTEKQFEGIRFKTFTRDSGGIVGAYGKAQDWLESKGADDQDGCIVELHYNAFNGKANYTVTMYDPDGDKFGGDIEKRLADKITRGICDEYNTRFMSSWNRNSGHIGYYNVSRALEYPSILIEPFFGDNPSMAGKFHQKFKLRANLLKSLEAFYS